MALEIERKFLVRPKDLPSCSKGEYVRQGYVATGSLNSVRARIKGDRGYLTLKGPSSKNGLTREEFEYEIPVNEAHSIISGICDGGTVEKTRFEVTYEGFLWEVDVFDGHNKGLIIAEVELPSEDTEIAVPPWVSAEVTGDPRFYNMRLALQPWQADTGDDS